MKNIVLTCYTCVELCKGRLSILGRGDNHVKIPHDNPLLYYEELTLQNNSNSLNVCLPKLKAVIKHNTDVIITHFCLLP